MLHLFDGDTSGFPYFLLSQLLFGLFCLFPDENEQKESEWSSQPRKEKYPRTEKIISFDTFIIFVCAKIVDVLINCFYVTGLIDDGIVFRSITFQYIQLEFSRRKTLVRFTFRIEITELDRRQFVFSGSARDHEIFINS